MNFYQITNQMIQTAAASSLSSLDEFNLTLVSISTELLTVVDSTATTIGQQLYQKKAQLNFLNQTYNDLISINSTFTNAQYTNLGNNKALRDYSVLNNTLNMTYWQSGLYALTGIFNSTDTVPVTNITALETYLWTYFQLFYNTSFVLQADQLQYQ